jgi:hypothetical protein
MVKRWNVPKPPSDPREEIAAHYGASGAVAGVGTGMARTFRGAHPNFLKDRQAYAQREMDQEYKNPHPDPGVHNAYMMHLADMHNSARDELARQTQTSGGQKVGGMMPSFPTSAGTGATAEQAAKIKAEHAERVAQTREIMARGEQKNAENASGSVDHEVAVIHHRESADRLRAAGHEDAASWHDTAMRAHMRAAAKSTAPGLVRDAQDASIHAHTAEAKAIQTGPRGGKHYVTATGAKVYVKDNPGATVVGHMSNQRFHQGLPMSAHLAEPKKVR